MKFSCEKYSDGMRNICGIRCTVFSRICGGIFFLTKFQLKPWWIEMFLSAFFYYYFFTWSKGQFITNRAEQHRYDDERRDDGNERRVLVATAADVGNPSRRRRHLVTHFKEILNEFHFNSITCPQRSDFNFWSWKLKQVVCANLVKVVNAIWWVTTSMVLGKLVHWHLLL